MNRLRRILAAGLAACAGPALAASFNVSELVTGTHQADPSVPGQVPIPCGSACKYASLLSAGMSNSYLVTPGTVYTDNWALPFVSSSAVRSPGSLHIGLALDPTPDGEPRWAGTAGAYQRALAMWDSGIGSTEPNVVTVQSWDGGSGASVVSYGIRLTTPSGSGNKPTFLKFKVPERLKAVTPTRTMLYSQTFYYQPDRAQSRAAMDVYVDGIPVWTAGFNSLVPQRYSPVNGNQLEIAWDWPLDGDTVTLFLGQLPAGSTRMVALVMRADLRVDASGCRDYTSNGTYRSCHSQREGMTLPGFNSGSQVFNFTPDVQIYTK